VADAKKREQDRVDGLNQKNRHLAMPGREGTLGKGGGGGLCGEKKVQRGS